MKQKEIKYLKELADKTGNILTDTDRAVIQASREILREDISRLIEQSKGIVSNKNLIAAANVILDIDVPMSLYLTVLEEKKDGHIGGAKKALAVRLSANLAKDLARRLNAYSRAVDLDTLRTHLGYKVGKY